jgi:hypothetical protein
MLPWAVGKGSRGRWAKAPEDLRFQAKPKREHTSGAFRPPMCARASVLPLTGGLARGQMAPMTHTSTKRAHRHLSHATLAGSSPPHTTTTSFLPLIYDVLLARWGPSLHPWVP